jgi:hypothetical protein
VKNDLALSDGIIALVLILGLLISGWLVSRRLELARVDIGNDYVIVRPLGLAKVAAFRRKLCFDRAAIRRAEAGSRSGLPVPGLRLRGTGMKNLQAGILASTNRTGIIFCLTGRAEKFLRVNFGRGKIRYLALQVKNPKYSTHPYRTATV